MNKDPSSENTVLSWESIYHLIGEYPYTVGSLLWDFNLMGVSQGEVMELLTCCIKLGLIHINLDGFLEVVK